MFYCAHCNSVYDPLVYRELLNSPLNFDGVIVCPIKGCDGQIVDIDENFIPLIHTLYKFGVNTTNCCSSHNWEMKSENYERSMYFAYDYEYDLDTEFVSEFTEQLKQLTNKYESLSVKDFVDEHEYNYIDLEGYPQTTHHTIGVYYDSPKYDSNSLEMTNYANLLLKQAEFMHIINEAIDKTADAILQEILEEDDELTISKEEIMQELIVR